MSDSDDTLSSDLALKKTQEFERIANELFEVDRKGILLQGVLSVLVAGISSFIADVIGGLDPFTAFLIFLAVFIPNFGLKVVAEYIKKRALIKGMKQGYKEGRKDSILNDTEIATLAKWAKVYHVLNSATFGKSINR